MTTQALIIFDCDGVLIDSEGLAAEALVAELSCHNINISPQDALAQFVGLNASDTAQKLGMYCDLKITDDFWGRVRVRRQKLYDERLKPTEGIFALLESIKSKKCVASSSSPSSLEYSLSLVGLWDHFVPHIFSSTLVKNGKPAPDIFLFASEQMRVDPQHCLVIEDSLAGIRAAKAANMQVVGYAGGSHCTPEHVASMQKEGIERIFRSHDQIKDYLASS